MPGKIYQPFNSPDTISEIRKDLKGVSGIYCLFNLNNGDFYIGQSQDIANRMYSYYSVNALIRSLKGNMRITKALLSHGGNNFALIILEVTEIELLDERETSLISLLNPVYNILRIAGTRRGIKSSLESIIQSITTKSSTPIHVYDSFLNLLVIFPS
jgi:excinuclease UvrABC nuclease subunit